MKKSTPANIQKRKPAGEAQPEWVLRLYVAGETPNSRAALSNLKRLCEEYLAGQYSIEVIDLRQKPQLAESDQILAVPTLVRKLPMPLRKIIGDLSNFERVLVGLDVLPSEKAQSLATAKEPTND